MEKVRSKDKLIMIAVLIAVSLNLIVTVTIFSFILITAFPESQNADGKPTLSELLP